MLSTPRRILDLSLRSVRNVLIFLAAIVLLHVLGFWIMWESQTILTFAIGILTYAVGAFFKWYAIIRVFAMGDGYAK